jgi:hypothetical protein
MWGVSSVRWDYKLATFFNIQIRGLSDTSRVEIEENVNPDTEER